MYNLKEVFPLKGKVTKEIIENADIHNGYDCIGVQTLKAALGEKTGKTPLVGRIRWGFSSGALINPGERDTYLIVQEPIDMTKIKTETEVTFILDPLVNY